LIVSNHKVNPVDQVKEMEKKSPRGRSSVNYDDLEHLIMEVLRTAVTQETKKKKRRESSARSVFPNCPSNFYLFERITQTTTCIESKRRSKKARKSTSMAKYNTPEVDSPMEPVVESVESGAEHGIDVPDQLDIPPKIDANVRCI
jgi:hypothetical protein